MRPGQRPSSHAKPAWRRSSGQTRSAATCASSPRSRTSPARPPTARPRTTCASGSRATAGARRPSRSPARSTTPTAPARARPPADRATADYVRQRLAAYGWDAQIVEIPVWINYPRLSRLTLVEPVQEKLAVRETGVIWDKDATASGAFDAFHGYSASGDVTAQVVYANYGDVEDFTRLAAAGIDVHDRIALVRYGKLFRGLKVRNAERAGAAGVLIYSDPADDGYAQGDAYPRGQARPADAIQRGSVQFLSEGPGDPGTPGWPSKAGGKRLKHEDMKTVPRIPSLPIAYAEAQKILARLEGPRVPLDTWQGALPLTYHVGPGPAVVHLESEQDWAVRPIWDVIATLKGRDASGQVVVGGNRRDAWTHGAQDPNSGTMVAAHD